MKFFRTIFVVLCLFVTGCNEEEREVDVMEYTGELRHTVLGKDVNSLCYSYAFTPSDGTESFGVDFTNSSGFYKTDLGEKLLNRNLSGIKIRGVFKEFEREFSKVEQRPIDAPVYCEVFEVEYFESVTQSNE